MKTYQSITSLATSPAISSNSLYSNGFFVTLTPPPLPPPQHSSNTISTSNFAAPPTPTKPCKSTLTAILCHDEKPANLAKHNSFETSSLKNEQNKIVLICSNDEHLLCLQKQSEHVKNINIEDSDNDDELSVENTRL